MSSTAATRTPQSASGESQVTLDKPIHIRWIYDSDEPDDSFDIGGKYTLMFNGDGTVSLHDTAGDVRAYVKANRDPTASLDRIDQEHKRLGKDYEGYARVTYKSGRFRYWQGNTENHGYNGMADCWFLKKMSTETSDEEKDEKSMEEGNKDEIDERHKAGVEQNV